MTSTLKSNVTLSVTVLAIALGGLANVAAAKPSMGSRGGAQPSFEELDTNGDGLLTVAEITAHSDARFAQIDANNDGKLSAEEMTAHHDAKISQHLAKRTERMINRFDEDGDGALSAEELPQKRSMGAFLEKADGNGDGALSEEEFETARAKMEDRMKSHGHKWMKKFKHGRTDDSGASDGN